MTTPSLLVVTVDRLPAWILPAWGSTWVSAPAIDSLAASGLLLDRLVATSLDPAVTLGAIVGSLPHDIAAAGGRSRIVTDDPAVAEGWGGAGVEAVVVPAPRPPRRPREVERTALAALFAAAREAVAAGAGCVWVHATSLGRTWDAPAEFHTPYVDDDDPPPPSGTAVPSFAVDADTDPDLLVGHRQVFAGQASLLDRLLAALLETAARDEAAGGRDGGWTVCLVGVRGMPLGIHGRMGPPGDPAAEAPFGESIHLPAILRTTDRRMAGQRYAGIVIPEDLGATLRDLVGLSPPPRGAAEEGRSLVGLLDRWEHRERDRAISVTAGGVAITTAAWRWIDAGGGDGGPSRRAGRLHALPDDFFEMCDVADRCPAEAAELAGLATRVREGRMVEASTAPLSAATGGPRP